MAKMIGRWRRNAFAFPRRCDKKRGVSTNSSSPSTPVSRSGRFAGGPAADVARFTESISFDWRLWRQDIAGSLAHAAMLRKIGVLTRAELASITRGLKQIGREIAAGKFSWDAELEDVHMNIESELTRRVPAGAKLHTSRSRNDQVALDVRLWLRDEIIALLGEIAGLQRALVGLGERNSDVIIPGYTHLQRAQPVYLAHHLLAYVEMLERDSERLWDGHSRVNVCPLGSGAIAGSTLPLDREFVARQLGFVDASGRVRLTQNSMDAVSDRDFLVEFAAAAALLAVHLSRLAEDVILWVSAEFNYLKIADAYTTGSSLMPQKKNPDIAELARGKTGRVNGHLIALLTLMKGQPLAYNKDNQEDKEPLFDAADTLRDSLRAFADMIPAIKPKHAVMREAALRGFSTATDLADYLVRRGLPFRDCHEIVGHAVKYGVESGKDLAEMSLKELREFSDQIEDDVFAVLTLEGSVNARNHIGGTAPAQVKLAVARGQALLASR